MDILTKAFAKINLHLEVLNKRPDGYHNIYSLMARVGLFDLLKLDAFKVENDPDGPVSVTIVPSGGPFESVIRNIPDAQNLIARAVGAYFKHTGLSGTVTISIEKNIPAGAGLGGGSSDAAAVLKILNENASLFNIRKITGRELMAMGAGIGADIPFCLTGGFAICQGIGERVTPVTSGLRHKILVVFDDIHVNTAQAYRSLNRDKRAHDTGSGLGRTHDILMEGLAAGDTGILKKILKNDFEEAVFRKYPRLREIKDLISAEGADFTAMTGSGSGIIGLFSDEQSAQAAKNKVKKTVNFACVTEFL